MSGIAPSLLIFKILLDTGIAESGNDSSALPTTHHGLVHQLTRSQLVWLDQMIYYAGRVPSTGQDNQSGAACCLPPGQNPPAVTQGTWEHQQQMSQQKLDQTCLQFSIVLLDHTIFGDLFESVVVGFLAALGINMKNRVFYDACSYTSHLSALVKIAQLLVVQQAVTTATEGAVPHPGIALDEMREKFMTYNTRSPFAWITRLRTFGKKVRK